MVGILAYSEQPLYGFINYVLADINSDSQGVRSTGVVVYIGGRHLGLRLFAVCRRGRGRGRRRWCRRLYFLAGAFERKVLYEWN